MNKKTELGIYLNTYRATHGIRQQDMAMRLGMSQSYLSRIENGTGKQPTTFIINFIEAYKKALTTDQINELTEILMEK